MVVSIVLPELTGLREDAVRKPRRNPKRRGELAAGYLCLCVCWDNQGREPVN